MFIKPTKDAKDLYSFNDDIYMEALLYPAHDDVPCPWDADFTIEEGMVILEGGLASGGAGHCICKCKVEEFSKFYKLEIPDGSDISDSGWVEA